MFNAVRTTIGANRGATVAEGLAGTAESILGYFNYCFGSVRKAPAPNNDSFCPLKIFLPE